MEKIEIDKILRWTNSKLKNRGKFKYINSFSTDTRSLKEKDFFIPLKGENFDGHDYIGKALKKGAKGFVYEKNYAARVKSFNKNKDILIIETGDSLRFLEDLAYHYIRLISPVVVGITGSVGKTTTKDLLVSILKRCSDVKYTPKNFNNEIGVSKSVLNVDRNTDYFIAELAMRGRKQISLLSKIVNTKIGIITNVSESHLEFFNSVEEIALEKSQIAKKIEENNGALFLNYDNKWADLIKKNVNCRIINYGKNNRLDFNFIDKGHDKDCKYTFDFCNKNEKLAEIKLGVPGYNNIYNSCAAAAVAFHLGVSLKDIKAGINDPSISEKRLKMFIINQKTIINDCYNASPVSVMGAIDILTKVNGGKVNRTIAILGDMLELGGKSAEYHFNIGRYLKDKEVGILITFGKLSKNTYKGFLKKGAKKENAFYYENKIELINEINKILKKGDIVLIKGSRANKMEDIIKEIR